MVPAALAWALLALLSLVAVSAHVFQPGRRRNRDSPAADKKAAGEDERERGKDVERGNSGEKAGRSGSPAAASLRRRYLVVYLIMAGADWMQGSYVYAIYDEFGLSMYDIALLYVADFASALFVGTAVAR
jgi:Sugar-tranasporters, 12 TM